MVFDNFSYLANNSKISACNGATSTVLESLAHGCYLIVPTDSGYEKKIFKTLNVSNNFFRICETEKQIINSINFFTKKRTNINKNFLANNYIKKVKINNINIFINWKKKL